MGGVTVSGKMASSTSSSEVCRSDLIAMAVLLCASFAVISPSLGGDFLNWDDDRFIVENDNVNGLSVSNIEWAFSDVRFELYQPLFLISLMFDGQMWGDQPVGYRAHNLLLHLMGVLLLYVLLRRLGMPVIPALVGTLFFALSPARVESVAWISSRKDVLMFVLCMITWHLHLSASRTRGRRIIFRLAASLVFIAALLSKSAAMVLPLMFVTVDVLIRGRGLVRSAVRALPFAVPAALVAAWVPTLWGNADLLRDPLVEGALGRITLVGWTFNHYLKTAFWPFDLSPLYSEPHPTDVLPASICALAFVSVATTLILVARKNGRKIRTTSAGLLLFLFGLMPYLNIVPIYYLVADRYLLLPGIGIALLGARLTIMGIEMGTRHRIVLAAGITAVLVSWGVAAGCEATAWTSSRGLWEHATSRQPDSFFARLKYGETLRDLGEPIASSEQYREARRIRPGSPTALAGVFWGELMEDARVTPTSEEEITRLVAGFLAVMNDGRKMMPFASHLKREGYPRAAIVVAQRYREWLAPVEKVGAEE